MWFSEDFEVPILIKITGLVQFLQNANFFLGKIMRTMQGPTESV